MITRMQFFSIVLVNLFLCNVAAQGQLRSLYADPKAGRVGDALTVLIQENASATNQTSTSTGKNNAATVTGWKFAYLTKAALRHQN